MIIMPHIINNNSEVFPMKKKCKVLIFSIMLTIQLFNIALPNHFFNYNYDFDLLYDPPALDDLSATI